MHQEYKEHKCYEDRKMKVIQFKQRQCQKLTNNPCLKMGELQKSKDEKVNHSDQTNSYSFRKLIIILAAI